MIETGSSIGLSEIGQGAVATVDISEVGSFNPNAQAFYGIDPHSAHIGVARVVGITTVVSRPTGGILSGTAALMNLAGDTPPKMAVNPEARAGHRAAALRIRRTRLRARRRRATGRQRRRESRPSAADGFAAHDAARRRGVRKGAGSVRQGQVDSAPGARRRARRRCSRRSTVRCR